jgi:hypothetical protein
MASDHAVGGIDRTPIVSAVYEYDDSELHKAAENSQRAKQVDPKIAERVLRDRHSGLHR